MRCSSLDTRNITPSSILTLVRIRKIRDLIGCSKRDLSAKLRHNEHKLAPSRIFHSLRVAKLRETLFWIKCQKATWKWRKLLQEIRSKAVSQHRLEIGCGCLKPWGINDQFYSNLWAIKARGWEQAASLFLTAQKYDKKGQNIWIFSRIILKKYFYHFACF